jgi:hypothetical protein
MAEAVTSSSLSDPTPTFARRGVTHTTEFVSYLKPRRKNTPIQPAAPGVVGGDI